MKVGDYVRTKDGYIGKISKIQSNERNHLYQKTIYTDNFKLLDMVLEENIIKSSPNIIDLIEVGDYVNGCRIQELVAGLNGEIYLETELTEFDNVYACGNINIYEKDIKSIVTKEQFERIKYEVE